MNPDEAEERLKKVLADLANSKMGRSYTLGTERSLKRMEKFVKQFADIDTRSESYLALQKEITEFTSRDTKEYFRSLCRLLVGFIGCLQVTLHYDIDIAGAIESYLWIFHDIEKKEDQKKRSHQKGDSKKNCED